MIKKILIANRGEIACRVIRTARKLNINTVAVYSDADKDSLFVKQADESYHIGGSQPAESYLDINKIINIAKKSKADAIHPGYGFLSENAAFVKRLAKEKIKFIGPNPNAIKKMGDKIESKNLAIKLKLNVIPGHTAPVKNSKEALKISNKIGYPVLLKASAGGGGKGMRVIKNANEAEKGFNIIQNEAGMAFNNSEIYVEKFVENGRHIEVQILSDKFGNHLHLGERECSIQRSNQKLIEESPSLFVDDNLRDELTSKSLQLAKKVNYVGAGTIEYLVDDDKNFYFIEMNTRIQVEHTVTEMVCMIDLVKEQIRTYAGIELSMKQEDITMSGHAIECRINAEDPFNDFIPSPNKIDSLNFAGGIGVRIDSFIYAGYQIPTNYDSMLGKLIVHSSSREKALIRMKRSLQETFIEGPKTTLPLLEMIFENKDFNNGNFDINFLGKFLKNIKEKDNESS